MLARTRTGMTLVAMCAAGGAALVGCGSPAAPPTPPTEQPPAQSQPSNIPPGSTPESPRTAPGAGIGKEQAGRIATGEHGGQIKNIEVDHARGRATWEVEIRDSLEGRIEVEVARDNGEILAVEHD